MDMLNKLKKDIDNTIRSFIKDAEKYADLKMSSPLLYAGIKDFLARPGKRIRPLLFVLSYLGYTKRKNFSYKNLINSSLSLEMLHNFMLMHDDVIDKSALRRGKPTLHRVFNKKLGVSASNELGSHLSIVAGDVVFAMATSLLLSFDEEPRRKEKALLKFTETAATTGIGEFIDVVNNVKKIEKVRERDVFLTYTLKTAKYTFESPLLMGAILAGAQEKELKKLSKLGIMLGQAFQVQDDLLDVFSSTKKIGKPVLSDLSESKKTLLVWKAYKSLSAKDKKTLKRLLEKKKKTHRDLLKMRDLISSSGADKYCLSQIMSTQIKARRMFSQLLMAEKYKAALYDFTDKSFSKLDSLDIT